MKTEFLQRAGNPELILCFNGWSRDAECLRFLAVPESCDVLECHDYTLPDHGVLTELSAGYRKIHLIAWSLGVWAAAEALEKLPVCFASSLAVNGTLTPIDAEEGIAPEIFDGTISHWTEERARAKFQLRMAGSRGDADALPIPARTPEEQQRELAAIRARFLLRVSPVLNCFERAVAGRSDRIFPFENQVAAWKKTGIPVTELALPHYPWNFCRTWKEVLDLGSAR